MNFFYLSPSAREIRFFRSRCIVIVAGFAELRLPCGSRVIGIVTYSIPKINSDPQQGLPVAAYTSISEHPYHCYQLNTGIKNTVYFIENLCALIGF